MKSNCHRYTTLEKSSVKLQALGAETLFNERRPQYYTASPSC